MTFSYRPLPEKGWERRDQPGARSQPKQLEAVSERYRRPPRGAGPVNRTANGEGRCDGRSCRCCRPPMMTARSHCHGGRVRALRPGRLHPTGNRPEIIVTSHSPAMRLVLPLALFGFPTTHLTLHRSKPMNLASPVYLFERRRPVGMQPVKRQIKLHYVDARFSENPSPTGSGV